MSLKGEQQLKRNYLLRRISFGRVASLAKCPEPEPNPNPNPTRDQKTAHTTDKSRMDKSPESGRSGTDVTWHWVTGAAWDLLLCSCCDWWRCPVCVSVCSCVCESEPSNQNNYMALMATRRWRRRWRKNAKHLLILQLASNWDGQILPGHDTNWDLGKGST